MKIVILDGYTENPGDLSWDALAALGELTVYDRSSRTDQQEAIDRIGDAEIVITNKTPITRAVLDACPSVRFIGVLATGYNVVDTACTRERGIPVSNVPAYGTAAVGQFTIALLLEICHHVAHHSETVFAGKWEHCPDFCYWDYPLIELDGKTMGIIGFGRIGQATGRIAKALGMRVLATGSRPCPEGEAIAEYTDLDTLLANSDVIALHCPLFPETAGIINRETIAKMKDGVILLNSARGGLVVEQDLADALNSGKVAAAGLDVVSTEPIQGDNPLLKAKNCIITPHIAWGSKESRQRIMDCTVKNVQAFLAGKPVNTVNGL
ncbi:MAG: D-2-hydroxyacid dehydrogenase [Dysosmobacter sp.]|nr:D-2-hydroxyacid dehydrogenase [Dysosmobacter sp.]